VNATAKQTKVTENHNVKTEAAKGNAPQTAPVLPKDKEIKQQPGIEISRELYEMAGFDSQQQLDYTVIK